MDDPDGLTHSNILRRQRARRREPRVIGDRGTLDPVKIATGTVTNGQIVVEGEAFSEGEKVTILGYDDQTPFRVTPEEKRLLLESIAQADRGEFVDAETLLAELDESN